MVKDEASISFHKTCYKSGEIVTGDIYINVNWERKVEAISLQFYGYEKVEYEDDFKKMKSNTKPLLNETILIAESGDFYPGSYEYPFEHQLPDSELPSSFHTTIKQFNKKVISTIFYEAILLVEFTKGKKIETYEELIICDEESKLSKPIISAKNKVFPDNSSVTMKLDLEKDIYKVGEQIRIISNITNETSRQVSLISVKLLLHLTAQADSQYFQTINECFSDILTGVEAQTKDTRTIKINVPSKLQPNTNGEIIQAKYFLQIHLDLGTGSDLDCSIPLLFVYPKRDQSFVPGFHSRTNSNDVDTSDGRDRCS
eukprot:gene2791-4199_t